ncbi:cytochrome-c peroxidase [Marinirhabdus gelatinilytica]|uniref:Cytochrome c peroxidase n=1 Tax=Marinirhabdus gelatinilytica TaxID=1703343 RepID=A0A370QFH8_9FLAO|nr:cytochrome c peroxidase [Marinirhabdus gelatinilytica]RDK87123.1 cytochrome c peroxidase [Marinirhabdus gelatinilytica]
MGLTTTVMTNPKFLLLLLAVLFFSCQTDEYTDAPTNLDKELADLLENNSQGQGLSYFILPNEKDYASIPQDPLNPITEEKVRLGRLLVHETATGGNPKMPNNKYTYACASCHPAASGFSAGIRQGIGEGGIGFGFKGEGRVPMDENSMPRDSIDVQPIKPPTLLNVAYQEVALWNGALGAQGINAPYVQQNASVVPENLFGFQGLETQGIAGQTLHRLKIDEEFAEMFGYKPYFNAAFPSVPEEERYSQVNAALAIAAFNRTILTNQAPWQEWLKGDVNALTENQKKGAIVFFDKGKCYECHTGPALKSNEFHAWGLLDFNPEETIIFSGGRGRKSFNIETQRGRGEFTGRAEDDYKFKVPTLYNLKMNKFYGHGGSVTSIREVVEYKNAGVKQNPNVPDAQIATQFGALDLTEEEISYLVDFLENGLYDPTIARYAPAAVLSGNCIPNNDEQSRIDLGCD